MSQARVTDFFSTRKRNRFNQEDILLNKQKRTQTLIDSSDFSESSGGEGNCNSIVNEACKLIKQELEMRTRSKSKQLADKQETESTPPDEKKPDENEENPKRRSSLRKKQQTEELKQKVSRLDHKLSKLENKLPEAPAELAPIELAPVSVKTTATEAIQETAKKPKSKKVNMAELKQRMQKFNENLNAVKENFANQPAEVATAKSKVSEQVTNIPEPTPAHIKFKDLASADIDISCTLTLPSSYSQLLDAFKGSDTIVKFLYNRQEICTFLKLKMGIQNITKHTFSLSHLGQIKSVYPLAYLFKQEKMFIDFKNDYHLTIYPNLDELEMNVEKGIKEFSPNVLLKRLNAFKSNLFKIVKEFHQKFLESIGLVNIDSKEIKRWHPKFDLETLAAIQESELPKSPNEAVKCKTGQDLLNIAKDVYSARIKEAIKDHLIQNEPAKKEEPAKKPVEDTFELEIVDKPAAKMNVTSDIKSDAKVNVDSQVLLKLKEKKAQNYSSLLEKIRNKEKTKAFESMIVNSDKEKKLARYAHYKEAIRFLLGFFQSEKKSTIEQDKVITKLADNMKEKLNELDCRELLNELCDLEKFNMKWISTIKVRNVNYIKMDKSFQLNDLWAKCDKMIEEL